MRVIAEEVYQDQVAYEDATHLGIRNGLSKFEKIKKKNMEEARKEE